MRKLIVTEAQKYLDFPSIKYSHPQQGMDTNGFDCSGFLTFLLRQIQFPTPSNFRHVAQYFDYFGVFIHEECVDCGDLVFMSYTGIRPNHIGIMISPTEFIHAPGLANSRIKTSKLKKRAITHCPENPKVKIYFHNPIGFKRLATPNVCQQEIYL